MTLLIIFGAVVALYLAMLLMRLAIFALPISAGLIAASLLQTHGISWTGAAAGGFVAGLSLYGAGRSLVTSDLALLTASRCCSSSRARPRAPANRQDLRSRGSSDSTRTGSAASPS